jgi:hypothetical protein
MGVARIGQISGAVCRKEFLGGASDNPSEAWSEKIVMQGRGMPHGDAAVALRER